MSIRDALEEDPAEVVRLMWFLLNDPSSAVTAALAGWAFPISRETLAVLDLFDLTHQANSDPKRPRPKRHAGRPFKTDGEKRHGTPKPMREAVAILNRFGHKFEAPA